MLIDENEMKFSGKTSYHTIWFPMELLYWTKWTRTIFLKSNYTRWIFYQSSRIKSTFIRWTHCRQYYLTVSYRRKFWLLVLYFKPNEIFSFSMVEECFKFMFMRERWSNAALSNYRWSQKQSNFLRFSTTPNYICITEAILKN